jgi:hypothetical protein
MDWKKNWTKIMNSDRESSKTTVKNCRAFMRKNCLFKNENKGLWSFSPLSPMIFWGPKICKWGTFAWSTRSSTVCLRPKHKSLSKVILTYKMLSIPFRSKLYIFIYFSQSMIQLLSPANSFHMKKRLKTSWSRFPVMKNSLKKKVKETNNSKNSKKGLRNWLITAM